MTVILAPCSRGGALLLVVFANILFFYLLIKEPKPWSGKLGGWFLMSCIFGPFMDAFLLLMICLLVCERRCCRTVAVPKKVLDQDLVCNDTATALIV